MKMTKVKEAEITMQITNDILYVGVNDHQVDLFEGQYDVPNGMAYNSYVSHLHKISKKADAKRGPDFFGHSVSSRNLITPGLRRNWA